MIPEPTRIYSFKGRKNWATASWKKNGIKNVITIYLNKWGDWIKEEGNWDDELLNTKIFILLDFHEWLHLFIHRDSGLKNTYICTDECEKFIEEAHEVLGQCLDIIFPEPKVDVGWLEEFYPSDWKSERVILRSITHD